MGVRGKNDSAATAAYWLAACVGLLACSDGGYSIAIRFPSETIKNEVTEVRIRILRDCESNMLVGEKNFVFEKNDADPPSLGNLEPGTYGIEAVAYDRREGELCAIARGCVDEGFDAGGKKTVLIETVAIPVPICMAVESDAGMDGSPNFDAGRDAGEEPDGDIGPEPDTSVCTPDTEVCNDRDDDCDENTDETTDKQTDRANCGTCDNLCDEGLTCAGGRCAARPVQLALGQEHSCALREDGRVLCWGKNLAGQLGTASFTERLMAAPVVELQDVREIGAGSLFTCALRSDAKVLCWGENIWGQLGMTSEPTRNTTVVIARLDLAVSLGVGFQHACVVTEAGDVSCWGWNGGGQLGRSFVSVTNFERIPAVVPDVHDVTEVSAGFKFTCARHGNGTVSCWGTNDRGQLGDGTTTSRITAALVMTESSGPLDDVIDLAVGSTTACALQEGSQNGEGTVVCWGDNSEGTVGSGSTASPMMAPVATSVTDAVEITIGTPFACARRRGGSELCWGLNDYGQIGDGSQTTRRVPTGVSGLTNATALHTDGGFTHNCAIRNDFAVVCWGSNAAGQLGNGTKSGTPTLTPGRVMGL